MDDADKTLNFGRLGKQELQAAALLAQEMARLEQENQALRRQLEQRQQVESHQSFHAKLLDYVNDAILTLDSNYILTGWSQGAEQLYGWRADEAVGRPLNEIIRTEISPAEVQEALHALHATGHYKMELSQYTRDGRRLLIEARGLALKDEHGQLTGYVSANLDITQQKVVEQERARYLDELQAERLRAEQALTEARQTAAAAEESKRILEALMEYIPEGISIADAPDVNIRMVSRFGRELTGRRVEEIEGIPYSEHPEHWQIYSPDDNQLVPGELLPLSRAILQGEIIENEELILHSASGKSISILCNAGPIRDPHGQITGGIIAYRDITERKRVEENLRHSRELLRTIIDNASAVIYAKDINGRFILTNHYHAALLGRHPREVVGKLDVDFKAAAPRAEEYEVNDQQVLAQGQPITFEEVAPGLDGSEHTYLAIKFPLFDQAGNIYGLCGISTDISDRKRVEETLNQYAVRLEQVNRDLELANRELKDFAYIASHDLQEPLRKVIKFGELLQVRYGSGMQPEGQEYLDRMVDAVHRMQDMIKGLLTYSHISTRERMFSPVDLNQVAHDVLKDLEIRIEQTKGKVELDHLPVIESDDLQMRQLLQNLIGNALKFHKPGVPPIVKVWAEIAPASNKEGCCLRLMVQDNGIGFNPELASKLFQPFIRLHGRSEYEGTGMGLAICRKIAERHAGEIKVNTQPGVGSIFIVTLHAKTPPDSIQPRSK